MDNVILKTLLFVLPVILLIGVLSSAIFNQKTEVCQIFSKQITYQEGFLVDSSCGVFRIRQDSFVSERLPLTLFNQLEEGGTYRITSGGFNAPSLTIYRNIIKVSS